MLLRIIKKLSAIWSTMDDYLTRLDLIDSDFDGLLNSRITADLKCRFAEFLENIDWTYSNPRVNGSINKLPFNGMLSHGVQVTR